MLEKMVDGAISNGFAQNPVAGSVPPTIKKKRNLPGTPDPEAEVIALSPKTLMATNRFLCEICGKGFQRDQNLQLHRRGHNLPWKLKQRTSKEVRKRVYVCPEKSCVHNHPSRALGDLTGIKKHFCRKHGEKKWKCEKCQKRYAVQSDWKAHSKTCGTREYKCDCGTIFSRRDSFITHRAFCDALAEETARVTAASNINNNIPTTTAAPTNFNYHFTGSSSMISPSMAQHFSSIFKPISTTHELIDPTTQGLSLWMGQTNNNQEMPESLFNEIPLSVSISNPPPSDYHFNWGLGNKHQSCDADEQLTSTSSILPSANMSATALLQKAAQMGATTSNIRVLDDSKYCGLYGTNSACTGLGSTTDVESSSVSDQLCSLNQFQMYPAKRRHIQSDQEGGAGGQTRDFLGVGVQPIRHPPSINGWI
ncbi:hypothetical protein LguiA_022471 [Lonicera macranthoides]